MRLFGEAGTAPTAIKLIWPARAENRRGLWLFVVDNAAQGNESFLKNYLP